MVFEKFFGVFAIVLIGYLFGKLRKPSMDQVDVFAKIILWVFVPAIVISSSASIRSNWNMASEVLLISILTFVFLLVIAVVYTRIRKTSKEQKKLLMVTITLMNCGYLGIPVCESLGGPALRQGAVFYTVVYMPLIVIVSELTFAPQGVWYFLKKLYKDIYVLSVVVGLALSFIPQDAPVYFMIDFIGSIGDLAPSMMLILIGLYIALFKDPAGKEAWEATLLRNVSAVLVVLALSYFFSWSEQGQTLVIVQTMMPSALLPYFIAIKNGFKIKGFQASIILTTVVFMILYLLFPLVGI